MQEKDQQALIKNIKIKAGFSLVEVLVVATIIIVLATLGMVSYRGASKSSKRAKCKSDLESVRQALVMYRSEEGTYDTGSADWAGLVSFLQNEDYLADGDDFSPDGAGINYTINTLTSNTFVLEAQGGDCAADPPQYGQIIVRNP